VEANAIEDRFLKQGTGKPYANEFNALCILTICNLSYVRRRVKSTTAAVQSTTADVRLTTSTNGRYRRFIKGRCVLVLMKSNIFMHARMSCTSSAVIVHV
jgi:hypothetical protein